MVDAQLNITLLLCIGWYTNQHYPHCSVIVGAQINIIHIDMYW